jgi:hypothetical protein
LVTERIRKRTDSYGVEHFPETRMRLIPQGDGQWKAIVWSSVLDIEIEGPVCSSKWTALEAAHTERAIRQWSNFRIAKEF